MKSPRLFYLTLVLICGSLLGFGYYLQFVEGLEPCPLCIFQRLAYLAIFAIAALATIHGPQNAWLRIYSGFILFFAVIGFGIAGWQVRLQHMPPDHIPECGPGLDYMLEVFPLTQTLTMAFTGSGECAEVQWTFLSLSIAEWSLICFLFFAIISSVHLIRRQLFGIL